MTTAISANFSWDEAEEISDITRHLVHLSADASGTNRSFVGDSIVGTPNFTVPANTALRYYTYFLVCSRTSFVEETTPTAYLISDAVACVIDVAFVDKDMDPREIGV